MDCDLVCFGLIDFVVLVLEVLVYISLFHGVFRGCDRELGSM